MKSKQKVFHTENNTSIFILYSLVILFSDFNIKNWDMYYIRINTICSILHCLSQCHLLHNILSSKIVYHFCFTISKQCICIFWKNSCLTQFKKKKKEDFAISRNEIIVLIFFQGHHKFRGMYGSSMQCSITEQLQFVPECIRRVVSLCRRVHCDFVKQK